MADGRHAVLLRAINVGGRKLAMADFKAALGAVGCADAQTVGAAGTAVVGGKPPNEAELEVRLGAMGVPTDAFVRSGADLAQVVRANPFGAMAREDPAHLLVYFLGGEPASADVEALRGKIVGGEAVAAGPRCLYAAYPNGVGRSKLTVAVIERTLRLRGTGRNWNTVLKLAALTGGA